MKEDYYDILGVSKTHLHLRLKKLIERKQSNFIQIKIQMIKLRKLTSRKQLKHTKYLEIKKRSKYDQFGHAAFEGGQGFGQGMNMDDIFSQFGDIFGSAFGGGFGGGTQRRSRGSDMRIRVKLTLEEIASGVEKKIKVPRKVQAPGVQYGNCSTCNGTGQVTKIANTILGRMQTSSVCPNCSGSGKTILNRPQGQIHKV